MIINGHNVEEGAGMRILRMGMGMGTGRFLRVSRVLRVLRVLRLVMFVDGSQIAAS